MISSKEAKRISKTFKNSCKGTFSEQEEYYSKRIDYILTGAALQGDFATSIIVPLEFYREVFSLQLTEKGYQHYYDTKNNRIIVSWKN